MKVSLLIIVGFLCVYTTWVQTKAREVILATAAREEDLLARLGRSEADRIRAESALTAATKNTGQITGSADSNGDSVPETVTGITAPVHP